jgi:flagellar hook protein FlgE
MMNFHTDTLDFGTGSNASGIVARLQRLGDPGEGMGSIQPRHAAAMPLNTAGISPSATTRITIEMNLDSRVGVSARAAAGAGIDFADPRTYSNAASLTVYDAKGQDVALTCYFQKASADTWNVFVTANGAPVSTDALGNALATTRLQFRPHGGAATALAVPVALDIPASVDDLGRETLPITGVVLDLSGATQYDASFGVTDLSQDGCAPAQLHGIPTDGNGLMTARHSDGRF